MATGYILCIGDATTCGGKILTGNPYRIAHQRCVARAGDSVTCGKHKGIYQIIGGVSFITDIEGNVRKAVAGTLDSFSSCPCKSTFIVTKHPAAKYENQSSGSASSGRSSATEAAMATVAVTAVGTVAANVIKNAVMPVFAKSKLRGSGNTDAGEQPEPHTHFAEMAFYQAIPTADPASDNDVTQHAQTAKRKIPAPEDIPKPKKRSALYRWWHGNHEELNYQAAKTAATSAANAQTAVKGASVLGLVGGRAITPGTWAVSRAARFGAIAASGPGAPIAALLVGMYPGKLNDGEQDFIDRLRLEQMREAPTRVRYTWENDSSGNPVPHGWHTPPGKDRVRVRAMEWDSSRRAYTFTTEEEHPVTLIWTPDSSGVNVPTNTGNQHPPRIPNPVIVDPLPDNTGIETTTSPAAEEKGFADYILILPLLDMPPIYVYLSKPPVEFLEVELYSDFKRRSRQGKYEADHIPSRAAVEAHLKKLDPELDDIELRLLSDNVASIVIPKEIHQKLSETYGKRNFTRIEPDSQDLRAAANSNLDAITSVLKERGATEEKIEAAREKIHRLNSDMGLYK